MLESEAAQHIGIGECTAHQVSRDRVLTCCLKTHQPDRALRVRLLALEGLAGRSPRGVYPFVAILCFCPVLQFPASVEGGMVTQAMLAGQQTPLEGGGAGGGTPEGVRNKAQLLVAAGQGLSEITGVRPQPTPQTDNSAAKPEAFACKLLARSYNVLCV